MHAATPTFAAAQASVLTFQHFQAAGTLVQACAWCNGNEVAAVHTGRRWLFSAGWLPHARRHFPQAVDWAAVEPAYPFTLARA